MTSLEEAFALAFQHHRAGHLLQAEQLYLEILEANPGHADAHHLLGVLACQNGQYHQAVASIRRALTLNPNAPAYHLNLGLAHLALGQLEDALARLREALRLEPDSPEAHSNLANALVRLGNLEEAEDHYCQALLRKPNFADAQGGLGLALAGRGKTDEAVSRYRQALSLNPNFAEAHNNLADALLTLGRVEEAATHCRHALRIRPNYAEAHNNLANALQKQDALDEAIVHWHNALACKPDFADAHTNLANALKTQGKLEEAETHGRQALRLRPDFAEAHSNLGNVYLSQGKLEEATTHFQEALRLRPDFAEAHSNLGIALLSQGKHDDALMRFEEALRWRPDLGEAHYDRATLRLLCGDFEQGWPEYQWRWSQPRVVKRHFPQPYWDGSTLQSLTILLHAEQGFGDTLHFIRYAPLVKQRGGTVIVECHPPLLPLLASVAGIDRLVARGSPLPAFDVHAPLLSLPGIFRTSLANIPAEIPYLQADPSLVEKWRHELESLGGFKIGIAWQGNPLYYADRQRSIPLARFGRLTQVEGIRLVSLQQGPGAEQQNAVADQFAVLDLGSRLDKTAGAFMDTAAVMKNLDLIVSSDTVIPHLAGALAVPVWLALPLVPDWRWLLQRDDSPWYPTMRLFRQTQYGNWEDVFERLAQELQDLVAMRK